MKIVKADALGCDYKNTIVLSYNKGWNDFGYKTEYIICLLYTSDAADD